jgi:lysosomal acid lipase/cholesteryl ester hydrolase
MKKRLTLLSILISIYFIHSQIYQDSSVTDLPIVGHIGGGLSVWFTGHNQANQEPPYVRKVREEGYDFEEHKITTEDGYILTAWRIPGRHKESFKQRVTRKPIILQHGLCDSSYTWLMLNSTNSLAILLAEEGFDIWLTNSRGNAFSHEHVEHDSGSVSSDYWDFSFHEMGAYDLTANVRYVKQITGYEKVLYLGHSQGTVQYFIKYTLDPEFIENNIEKFVAMGTVANVFTTVCYLI